MKYAVIKINGKQFKVSEGGQFFVDRIEQKKGKKFEIKEVLLFSGGKKTAVGQPLVKDVKVTAVVVNHKRAKKIEVRRFKAKSRYRKKKGHKQPISEIRVEKISIRK